MGGKKNGLLKRADYPLLKRAEIKYMPKICSCGSLSIWSLVRAEIKHMPTTHLSRQWSKLSLGGWHLVGERVDRSANAERNAWTTILSSWIKKERRYTIPPLTFLFHLQFFLKNHFFLVRFHLIYMFHHISLWWIFYHERPWLLLHCIFLRHLLHQDLGVDLSF